MDLIVSDDVLTDSQIIGKLDNTSDGLTSDDGTLKFITKFIVER